MSRDLSPSWNWSINYSVGSGSRTFILIPGHGQAHQSLDWIVNGAVPEEDTVVVLRRTNCSGLIGWVGLKQQQAKAVKALDCLRNPVTVGANLVILVGHSLGALLARHVIASPLGRYIHGLVQIAPWPTQRMAVASNPAYIKRAVGALPALWRGLLWPSGGLVPSKETVGELFAAPDVDQGVLSTYCARDVVPDSSLAFLQMLYTYSGTREWDRVVKNGWTGHNVIVRAPSDRVVPHSALKAMSQRWDIPIVDLHPASPHCPQLAPTIVREHNIEVLRQLFETF